MLLSLSTDRKAELKKLNRSILVCFLELLDILINNPSSPEVRTITYKLLSIKTPFFFSTLIHSGIKKLVILVFCLLICII